MHYYPRNIKDWTYDTMHLNPCEEGIYTRLIEYYYLHEKPIPLDLTAVLRRVRLVDYAEKANEILKEFFIRTEDGWRHSRCDREIALYQKQCVNGAKGGRRKPKPNPTPNPNLTQTEPKPNPTPNPNETQTEPKPNPTPNPNPTNQEPEPEPEPEPLTTNQQGNGSAKRNRSTPKYDDAHLELAKRMTAPVQRRFPSHKIDLKQWANSVRLLQDTDNRSRESIIKLWKWVLDDPFWGKNIRTPMKLRDRDKQGLTYFDRVMEEMRTHTPAVTALTDLEIREKALSRQYTDRIADDCTEQPLEFYIEQIKGELHEQGAA